MNAADLVLFRLRRLATVLALFAFAMPAGTALASSTEEATLRVHGMVCSGCEATVEAVLTGLDGVHTVRADRTTETAAVVYDPSVVEPAAMAQAVNDNTYYEASVEDASAAPAPADPELARASSGGDPGGSGLSAVAAGAFALVALGAGAVALRRRLQSH